MKEKTKNILKIFGIYYLVFFLILIILMVPIQIVDPSDNNYLLSLSVSVLYPITHILYVLVFLPAIIVLYFLFKKFKGAKARILLTAFLIPFSNMIYYFIEYFIINNTDCYVSMFIGFYSIVLLLPSLLFATLFVPKSLLPFKKEVIKTLSLMFLFGWILIFITGFLARNIDDITDNFKIQKYEPVIEQIEQYKKENSVYPDSAEDTVKLYKNFSYRVLNDNKDYILTISNHYTKEFNYCSNVILSGCHPETTSHVYYKEFGKWIKAIEPD